MRVQGDIELSVSKDVDVEVDVEVDVDVANTANKSKQGVKRRSNLREITKVP